MIAQQRHDRIVRSVEQRGTVTVSELARLLGTSESTVRRDLAELDQAGRVTKVHGGATVCEDDRVLRDLALSERAGQNAEQKMAIAIAAAKLVKPGDFVYIDAGSTTADLVNLITETAATYVTNSVSHALKLVSKGCRALVTGGELKGVTEALVGADAVESVRHYNFSLGFWGTNGISSDQGATTPDREEAAVKRISIAQCNPARRYVLADASKFGMVAAVTFATLDEVRVLTNRTPPAFAAHPSVQAVDSAVLASR